jgi:hypothetical protein
MKALVVGDVNDSRRSIRFRMNSVGKTRITMKTNTDGARAR